MLTYVELVRLERSLRDKLVLSVYLEGTAEDFGAQHSWRIQLDNSLKDLRQWLAGSSHEERELFDRSVARLEELLGQFGRGIGSPGWAAFISGDDVREAESLAVPMPTMAVWSTGACVTLYVRAIKQTRPVILVLADARQARLYKYVGGVLARVRTLRAHAPAVQRIHMGDVPRLGFHIGTRGSAGRDEAQKALGQGTERLLHALLDHAVKLASPEGWILVGGIPEVAAKLTGMLKAVLPARVGRLDSLDVHATEADVRAAAQRGASMLRDAWDLRRIETMAADAAHDGLATLGAATTRQALEQGRVRELFLTHRYLEDHLSDAETLVRQAFDQGTVVEHVSGAAATRLDAMGGIGAQLRYRVVEQTDAVPITATSANVRAVSATRRAGEAAAP